MIHRRIRRIVGSQGKESSNGNGKGAQLTLFDSSNGSGGQEPDARARYRTLGWAREHVRDRLDEGVRCPCCGQMCKLYRRKLNSGMAATLCWLVSRHAQIPGETWTHVQKVAPRHVVRSNEIGKLVHWGLVQQRPSDDRTEAGLTRTSGLWRPTAMGVEFARGRILVPARVHLYDNRIHGWSAEQVSIHDALGSRFDYAELMAERSED